MTSPAGKPNLRQGLDSLNQVPPVQLRGQNVSLAFQILRQPDEPGLSRPNPKIRDQPGQPSSFFAETPRAWVAGFFAGAASPKPITAPDKAENRPKRSPISSFKPW